MKFYFSEFRHLIEIFRVIRNFRPDVLYVDRSNILIAAFVARFTKIPVVLRLYGVTPAMYDLLDVNSPSHYLYRWCYRSPFKLVIVTRDGSAAKKWINRALRKDTKYEILVNGVDVPDTVKGAHE